MREHHHIPAFEAIVNHLRLELERAVVVRRESLAHGCDRYPFTRLFAVTAAGEPSYVGEGPEGPRFPLLPDHVVLMPPNVDVLWHFAPGLQMVAFHIRLELFPGLDAMAAGEPHFRVAKGGYLPMLHELTAALLACDNLGNTVRATAGLFALLAPFIDQPLAETHRALANRRK